MKATALTKKLRTPARGMALLTGLVASLVLVLTMGCAMIPAAFTDRLDKLVKDNGAGEYQVNTTLSKDGKQLVGISAQWTCTADVVQLTGCHQQGVTFEGPK